MISQETTILETNYSFISMHLRGTAIIIVYNVLTFVFGGFKRKSFPYRNTIFVISGVRFPSPKLAGKLMSTANSVKKIRFYHTMYICIYISKE